MFYLLLSKMLHRPPSTGLKTPVKFCFKSMTLLCFLNNFKAILLYFLNCFKVPYSSIPSVVLWVPSENTPPWITNTEQSIYMQNFMVDFMINCIKKTSVAYMVKQFYKWLQNKGMNLYVKQKNNNFLCPFIQI